MTSPRISIIVATLNAEDTLAECIESVHHQTYRNRELIVKDGGSSDGTFSIIRAHSEKLAYWVSERDQGLYHAWNHALDHATGDWILFLGADDYLWSPTVLEEAAKRLPENAEKFRIAYGQVRLITANREIVSTLGAPWDQVRNFLTHTLPIPHPAVFHHRSLFENRGRFDPTFKIAGDYELLLRELMNNEPYFLGQIVVTGMRIGGMSASLRHKALFLDEMRRARRNNQVKGISLVLESAALRYRLRTLISRILGKTIEHWVSDFYRVLTGKRRIWTTGKKDPRQ